MCLTVTTKPEQAIIVCPLLSLSLSLLILSVALSMCVQTIGNPVISLKVFCGKDEGTKCNFKSQPL